MDRMEVRLLGPTQVRRPDGGVVKPAEWRTSKTLDLLRLLALHNGEPVSVGLVIDNLWPDVDEDRGRASLRTAASQLRKALGCDCVGRNGGWLTLEGAWVDTQAYDALLDEAEASRRAGDHARTVAAVQEAEAYYVGDLEVPHSSGDWLHDARERLRTRRHRALLDAAAAAASRCWMRDSLDLACAAAGIEMSEETARALMLALAGVGEVEKALEVYEVIRNDLSVRFGVDPSPQTRAVHLQVLTGTADRHCRIGLIGHEGTVSELAAVMSRMLHDEPRVGVVWLQGKPGSGRDSVVASACREAGLSMHDMGRDAWLRDRVTAPVSAWEIPDTDVVVMPRAESVPRHAMTMLDSLARQHGGVLVVPVRFAVQRQADGAGATDAVPHQMVEVTPLDEASFAELAESVLQGPPSPRLLRRLWAGSGGLSGAACQAARNWVNDGRIVWTTSGLELAAPGPAEPGASGSLRRRLRLLSPLAEDVVTVLAVAGVDVEASEVAAAALTLRPDRHADEVAALLPELVDTGILMVGPDGYRLRESNARPEILAGMRPGVRQQVHRIVADQVTMPMPVRVDHLIASGQHRRASVLGFAALDQAQAAGDRRAAQLLVTALAALPAHLRERSELVQHAADLRAPLRRRGTVDAFAASRPIAPMQARVKSGSRWERWYSIVAGVALSHQYDVAALLVAV